MGGIGGIYHVSGAPAESAMLLDMQEHLRHRGASAANGTSGSFGSFARFTGRKQDAFFHAGHLTVCIDGRLDDREELARRLGIDETPCNAELIGAAYMKWGEACPDHLTGDFAFAVWDASNAQLFCARDLFGVKPFYFHYRPGHVFIFGSEIKSLLATGTVPADLDDTRVADYLEGFCANEEYTFYEHIKRLPSAHAAIVDASGVRVWRYGSVEPDTDYAGDPVVALRERFYEAVRRRTSDAHDIGVTLSGGLDSSSIAAVAAETTNRLHSFSAIFEGQPECDEREFITDLTTRILCSANYIHGGSSAGTTLDELWPILDRQDEPFDAPNAIIPWRLYRAIGQKGLRIALDGHGGDEVVSQGTGYLKELAAARQWRDLHRELRLLSRAYRQPLAPAMLGYVAYGLRRQNGSFSTLAGAALKKMHGRWEGNRSSGSVVSQDLRRRSDLAARLRARRVAATADTEEERHRRLIDAPERAYAFEVLDRIAGTFDVEPRYPFWDADLVSLCLSIPPELKLKNGYGRFVLRRAMEERLPDSIRWRRTKTNFLPNLIHGLTGYAPKLLSRIEADTLNMRTYVDAAAAGEVCNRLEAGEARLEDVMSFLRMALLHGWLDQRASTACDAGVRQNLAAVCVP